MRDIKEYFIVTNEKFWNTMIGI